MADARSLPKVRRTDRRTSMLTWAFLGVFILALVAVIGLLLTGNLFSDQPTSDAERDYELLLDGLKKNPKNPAVLMTLAEKEFDIGRKGDGRKHAELAIKYGPNQPGMHLRYAQLMIRDNKLDEAAAAVEKEMKIAETSKSPEPYFLLAQIQADQKKYEEAIKTMDKGLDLAPQAADMRIVYAEILEKAGKDKRAIAQFTEALRFLPGDETAIAGLKRLGAPVPAPADSPHGQ